MAFNIHHKGQTCVQYIFGKQLHSYKANQVQFSCFFFFYFLLLVNHLLIIGLHRLFIATFKVTLISAVAAAAAAIIT